MNLKYLVVGKHLWNRDHFMQIINNDSEEWSFVSDAHDLQQIISQEQGLKFIFFLHWSELLPDQITKEFPCVCFHMTDVPYGRGGSPLQNLIARGHRKTKLTALRMTSGVDSGPVYMKQDLSLEGGTAEEIYIRASKLSCEMAVAITKNRPEPQPQSGDVVRFKRRNPEQSRLTEEHSSLTDVYDHIRMLDANGYPRAFLDLGPLRFEFSRVAMYNGELKADVKIYPQSKSHD